VIQPDVWHKEDLGCEAEPGCALSRGAGPVGDPICTNLYAT
jgi:hypothetical protein